MVMAKPAPSPSPKQEEARHALAIFKGADGRYYTERLMVVGDKVVERRTVADNFAIEGLLVDATIRLNQMLQDMLVGPSSLRR